MGEVFMVPVRTCDKDVLVLRTARLIPGAERVGLAFTDEKLLRASLGENQQWVRLSESSLRAFLRPLGITRIQYDPLFVVNMPATVGVPA